MISDYIKAGEFSFCGRCGENHTCTRGRVDFWCWQCTQYFRPMVATADAAREEIEKRASEYVKACETGRVTFEERRKLAESRMAGG